MTIVSLMNSCNAHPDVFVKVYDRDYNLCYSGRYDEIPELYLKKEVNEFKVKALTSKVNDYLGARILKMEIELDEFV